MKIYKRFLCILFVLFTISALCYTSYADSNLIANSDIRVFKKNKGVMEKQRGQALPIHLIKKCAILNGRNKLPFFIE